MGQVATCKCATVTPCCSSAEKSSKEINIEPSAVLRQDLHPEVRLIAWLRRRSGPDCDFGEVFEEIFGNREPVGRSLFARTLKERGADIDAELAFQRIDVGNKGAIGAADLEAWQEGVEKKEVEGLRAWRDWLRKRYATPSAAFHAMGKGEGDVLVEREFTESLIRLGFETDHPLELFRFVDKDFSGEVTFAEFKSAMRSVGLHRVKESRSSSRRTSAYSSKNASPRQRSPEASDGENAGPDPRKARRPSKDLGQPLDGIDPGPRKVRRPSMDVGEARSSKEAGASVKQPGNKKADATKDDEAGGN